MAPTSTDVIDSVREQEHYCDNHLAKDLGDAEFDEVATGDEGAVFSFRATCEVCGRDVEQRFLRQGTWDVETGTKLYSG